MKIRRSILFLTVIAALLVALIIWLGRKPAETPSPTIAETNAGPSPSTEHAITEPSRQAGTPVRSNAPAARIALAAPIPPAPSQTKAEQMKEGLAALNDEDVVFYGKVIDQFDAPVASAAVAGSIQVNNGTREGSDKVSLTTDANGLFTVSGHRGKALGINVSKAGYEIATTNTRFIYSLLWPEAERYNPDPNTPVVIRMWKLQGADPLVGLDHKYKLRYTDAPIYFDLLAGKVVPAGGDVRLTVNRSPGIVSERTLLDWSVQVEAVDGGLMDSGGQERVTYAAPEHGYQSSMTFIFSTNAPHKWFGAFNQGFFLMSRNGQVYSKLGLFFGINPNPDDPM